MWTRAQLKANAKYALRGRYGKCLLASLAVEAIPLLYSLITTIAMLVVVIPFYIEIFADPYVVESEQWMWNMLLTVQNMSNRINATPVSYTHLDVYKRQVRLRARLCRRNAERPPRLVHRHEKRL